MYMDALWQTYISSWCISIESPLRKIFHKYVLKIVTPLYLENADSHA